MNRAIQMCSTGGEGCGGTGRRGKQRVGRAPAGAHGGLFSFLPIFFGNNNGGDTPVAAAAQVLPGCDSAEATARFPPITAGEWLLKRRCAEYGASKSLQVS